MEAVASLPINDVAEVARGCLGNSPYLANRTVSCDYDNGVLRLYGRLRSFHHKQLAQETVRRLAGVRHIINETEVVD